jgi:uncharacterized protein (DUF1697 family)
MPTYISILRGINVGGHNKIRMDDLKMICEGLGFKEIRTYIQSGNVIFKTDKPHSASALSAQIEQAIKEKYAFQVPVIIRTSDEIHSILSSNPFLNEPGIDRDKLHVTFLEEEPSSANITKITPYDFPPDRFSVIGKEVYLYCPKGYGNTKLSNTFFEKNLQAKATTRNWRTILKLAELS